MRTASEYDVIVIGTGWGGLSAARALQDAGKKVLVLEAQDRRGGRALSHTFDGMLVDVGCSMIHGYDKGNPARDIAESFGAEVQVMRDIAPRVVPYEDDEVLDAAILGAEARKAGADGIDVAQVDRATVENDKSLYDHIASFAPSTHVLAYLRTNELGPGIPLEETAVKYWKYERNFAGVDAAPVKGYAALVGEVWQSVENAPSNPVKVVLNAEVITLEHIAAGAVKARTRDPRNASASVTIYTAPIVLSTIPLGVLKEKATTSFFSPPLPPSTLGALQRSRSGDLNKIYISYPSVWWPGGENKLLFLGPSTAVPTPDELTTPDDIWAHTTLVAENVAASISSRAGKDIKAVLLFLVGANAAQALERFSDAEIQASLNAFLVRKLGGTAPQPTAILVSRWRADPWARGAGSTPVTVGSNDGLMSLLELSRAVWDGHLFFAGEHTELNHHGSVAGAILSGEREARKILAELRRRRLASSSK
ncbi:hypothetical protein HDZ31DRAFT_30869 [Schizophyllum fasciatum]